MNVEIVYFLIVFVRVVAALKVRVREVSQLALRFLPVVKRIVASRLSSSQFVRCFLRGWVNHL